MMEEFKIGDKVRSKDNHNLVGTVIEICHNVDWWTGEVIDKFVTVIDDYQTEIQINTDNIEKIDEEKETKEMVSYKVGDIVDHPLYNESIIIDISRFESGHIEIVPLTGLSRGLPILVSINNVKQTDNKLIISIEDYNEMANTIENLKEENYRLKGEIINSKCRKDIIANALHYCGYQLPEVKSVLYHKPATIIFWKDGTKTVVKAQKNEKYDNEKGFVMAYLKKILGNEGNYYEEIKRWTEIQ